MMGPATGIDTFALQFLISQGVQVSKITVYLAEFENKMLLRPKLMVGGSGRKNSS